jgi:hypothetical protein
MHDGLKKFFDYHKKDGSKGDIKLLERVKADPSMFDTDRPDPLQVRPRVAGSDNSSLQIKSESLSNDILQSKRHMAERSNDPLQTKRLAVEFENPLMVQNRLVVRDPLALKSLGMKLKPPEGKGNPIKVVFTSSKNTLFNPHHIDKPNCKPLPNFADPVRNAAVVSVETPRQPTRNLAEETPKPIVESKPKRTKPDPKPFMAKLKVVLGDSPQYGKIKEAIRFYKENRFTQKQVIATFTNSIFDDDRRFRELPERKARWEMFKEYGEFVSSKYIDYYEIQLNKFNEDVFTETQE